MLSVVTLLPSPRSGDDHEPGGGPCVPPGAPLPSYPTPAVAFGTFPAGVRRSAPGPLPETAGAVAGKSRLRSHHGGKTTWVPRSPDVMHVPRRWNGGTCESVRRFVGRTSGGLACGVF